MTDLILKAFGETIFMVVSSCLIGLLGGIPLAVLLFNSGPTGLSPRPTLYHSFSFLINAMRSVPYIILTILLIPLSRFIVGSSIGMYAALVPLGFSALLLIAKIVEDALRILPRGLMDTGISMGASHGQIIWKILLPEALPNIISGVTFIAISLVGFSAMAGVVGCGGLGDLAIRYGYQRYNFDVLVIIVLILIAFVQVLQLIGNMLSDYTRK